MKSIPRLLAVSAAVFTLAACQTTDRVHSDLATANQVVARASTDPHVARHGSLELQRAQQTLRQAEAAWVRNRDEEEARHLAYLAQQRARTALAIGEQARSEEMVQQAATERERIRLEARTREAEQATRRAQAAQSSAQTAQASAQTARQQAEQSREEAEQARRRAEQEAQRAAQESQRAAALERELQELQSQNTQRGMVVTLGDVLFATGRAELSPGAQRSVDKLADVLSRFPERRVMIEGFTDSVGSEASNLALSQRRANAFRMALLARGVAGDRMEVRAHGEAYPVADNSTPAGRQRNRRVEVLFSDGQGRFIER